jgi:ATP-binding cassette subfamily C protein
VTIGCLSLVAASALGLLQPLAARLVLERRAAGHHRSLIVGLGVVVGIVMPRIRRAAKGAQRSVGLMGGELERVLGAFTTVKASGHHRAQARSHDRAVAEEDRSVQADAPRPGPARTGYATPVHNFANALASPQPSSGRT